MKSKQSLSNVYHDNRILNFKLNIIWELQIYLFNPLFCEIFLFNLPFCELNFANRSFQVINTHNHVLADGFTN